MLLSEAFLFDTQLPADSVEYIGNNLLAIGTYLYDPEACTRTGKLTLCEWDGAGLYKPPARPRI